MSSHPRHQIVWGITVALLLARPLSGAEAPFSRGVNLTGWFQASGPRAIQFTKFGKQDLVNIQSLGCDVIRLPINLHAMTSGAPDYTPDPLFLGFLDQVVDWAEELEIHLILDNHSFDPASGTDPNIGDILVPVWTQMAEHFKDRSEFLHYEILNEPHDIEDAVWNGIQTRVIGAIRKVDRTHTIIVGPAGWNSYNSLQHMSPHRDTNLIYTFHFYDPFLFTHQGATWTNPSMESLAGVPFPYYADLMPACPEDLEGSWVEGALNISYVREGTVARAKERIGIAAEFQAQRDVPLFCGEFGVYLRNSDDAERVYWYSIVRECLEEKGIAWTTWDYTGGFGLFERDGNDSFAHDLNVPLVEALGLTAPEQSEFVREPETEGFELYTDYIASGVQASSYVGDGALDYYDALNPAEGRYCLSWTGSTRYHHVGFGFKPTKDLSVLVAHDFCLDFWIRGDTPGSSLDVRFMDTDTGPDDHPWRMRMTIDEHWAAWDGTWQHVQIPLADFTEHGAWEGTWFNAQGLFDWTAVDRVEIVSEHHDLTGITFWFDHLQVLRPSPRRW
ncbi:MAG: glycoside hydrolase family 5 protein [Phycisphaerales bacterium]|nr:MAG: glycoside hydrolase family 5 protein [Phycisphaerales bacterium]